MSKAQRIRRERLLRDLKLLAITAAMFALAIAASAMRGA